MLKLTLIIFFISIFFHKSVISEESEINLIPKNPNSDMVVVENIEIQENKVDQIELKEDEEIQIFNNLDDNLNLDLNENLDTSFNIWNNSNAQNINFLFKELNHNLASSTIKKNLINSLIYGTSPPKDMTQSDFDKLRVFNLKSLDNVDAAINVIGNISTYEENKDFYDKIILEKSLVDYNLAAVCGVLDSNSKFKADTYLIKIKVFCSFLNDRVEEADFFNSMLLEENDDDYFQALYSKLIDSDFELKSINQYNFDNDSISLYSAIIRSIDISFTDDFVSLNSPQLLKSIAISPVTDISIRLKAAQKAYNLNSLDSESVAALYQSVDFTSSELRNPLMTLEANYLDDQQKAMALLFQSSRIQILPISRLEALNNFWEYSNNRGQSKLAYELSKDLLKSIEPTSELIDFAIHTSKAHFYNGMIEESKNWLKLIQTRMNLEDKKINKDYLQLIFLISVNDDNLRFEDKFYDDFFKSFDIENEDINSLELYLTTLEFIGFSIPNSLWEITAQKTQDERKIPSIYVMKLLEKAAIKDLSGEVFLSIAVSMKNNDWLEIHPQHINIIFENLKKIDKKDILRDLTLEILKDMS